MSAPPLGRRFLVVWAGQTISTIGSSLSAVGVAVWVFLETGSAAWLGVLTALAAVPFVVTGPFVKYVDRWSRRSVMIAADALAAIGPAVALVLAFAGRLAPWQLAVAGFVGGIGTSIQFPAAQAAIPALVDRDALGRANGLNQLGPAVGIVVGPVVATPLIAWFGITSILLVDLATFAAAVVATASIRFSDAVDPPGAPGVVDDGSWSSAWAWLRTSGRPLALLLLAMAIVNFCFAFFNVAVLALATDVAGPARAGLVLGAGGVAMVGGSIALGRVGVARRRIRLFASALALASAGCVIAVLHADALTLGVGMVVAVVAVPAVNAAMSTIFHEHVPARMQGRVFGLRSAIGRALEPIGSLMAGVVIAGIAVPAMREGGVGASTIGHVIGVGSERGAAAVLLLTGIALATVAVCLARSSLLGSIDAGSAARCDVRRSPPGRRRAIARAIGADGTVNADHLG